MLIYLLKASLVWLLMLALYELLYARSRHYFANRTYLLATLFLGALLPLLPFHIWNVDYLQPVALQTANTAIPSAAATVPEGTAVAPVAFNWYYLLWWMYAAGIAVVLALMIREVIVIMRYAIYGHQKRVGAYKVFETGKQHPPFSFMGWIFIAGKENYTDEQLDYIIRHEAAHNSRKHWLDILIMQIALAVFWFHPLIWRLRYQLKMQHEYEADRIASGDNAYSYGHFLLQAAVYQSAPLIAHSFFYSPIKNRITMLTKKQKKPGRGRYLAIIPVLAACFIFLSSATQGSLERIRVGDKTTFKGNDFYWTKELNDTIKVQDPVTGEWKLRTVTQGSVIDRMNDEPVKNYDGWQWVDSGFKDYNLQRKSFGNYIKAGFVKKFPNYSKDLGEIHIENVVIDKNGVIQYFDIRVQPDHPMPDSSFLSKEEMDRYVNEIQRLVLSGPKIKLEQQDEGKNIFFDMWCVAKFRDFHAQMRLISK